jgi:protein gp37
MIVAGNTRIAYPDATWNPVIGCTKAIAGCAHCFAERMASRLAAIATSDAARGDDPGRTANYQQVVNDKGRWNGTVFLDESALTIPLRWKKPRRILVESMGDLFHESVPVEFIDRVFAVMALCPQHTFLILTKRPGRAGKLLRDLAGNANHHRYNVDKVYGFAAGLQFEQAICGSRPWPLPNVWLGTSVENQETADDRIPHLLRCPAVVQFLSIEPLLEPIYLHCAHGFCSCDTAKAHWAIVGCESGPHRRPCDLQWVRDLRDQCAASGVPLFVKQLDIDGKVEHDITLFPADLRIRQMPKVNRYVN